LKALTPLERQLARRAAREQPLARLILKTFLRRGGPIPVANIADGSLGGALAALDEQDVIRVHAGQIDVAYPFSAAPTPFRVRFPGGRERYACCATDALGMAPMAGESVEITSACHHCGAPLHLSASPHGVGANAAGVMVWFGKRVDEACRAYDSL
jgi:hypothetical protein